VTGRIGVASHRPRFARSQGPLTRPTQKDSVRTHASGRDDE